MQSNVQVDLDEFDLQILARYQHDTRQTAETIGAEVGLSAAAVQRRLKRLRESGVIQAETARLAASAVGFSLTCIVTVDIDRETATELTQFKARMLACPEVQQCFYVTGATDFVIVVLTPDVAAYEAFTHKHLLNDSNVRSFTTHVVLDQVKAGNAVPLRSSKS
jgi:Lrp/AsnC family transcriptional regulator, leucine-responsive regulatory protein